MSGHGDLSMDTWTICRESILSQLKRDASGLDDDWWRKGRRGEADMGILRRGASYKNSSGGSGSANQADMRRRLGNIAAGAQPAVTKVLGFGGGGTASSVISYISRNGEIRLENELGSDLIGRSAASDIAKDWQPFFTGGERSRDLALFRVEFTPTVSGLPSVEDSLSAMNKVFEGRSFAVAFTQVGTHAYADGLLVLNLAGRPRLRVDEEIRRETQVRFRDVLAGQDYEIKFEFGRWGSGTRFGASELRKLVSLHPGSVTDERGAVIDSVDAANRLVHQDWRSKLESRGPRDHMHLLIGAPEEAKPLSFEAAVRHFLMQEFGGHRYVFAIHDPVVDPKSEAEGGKRPHLHAHVLITTRSNYGDRLKVWVPDLNRWRARFAECARAEGMAIEATYRHETMSAPAYQYKNVRPISFEGRTAHIGTSSSAQQRYDAKRSEHPHVDNSPWARNQAQLARRIWQEIADKSVSAEGQAFAQNMLSRFDGITRSQVEQISDAAPGATRADNLQISAPSVGLGHSPEIGRTPLKWEESRMVKNEQEIRRADLDRGGQYLANQAETKSRNSNQQARIRNALFSAVRGVVEAVQAKRLEREQGDFERHMAKTDFKRKLETEIARSGEPVTQAIAAGRPRQHIDLSQRERSPEDERPDSQVFASQEVESTQDRAEKMDKRVAETDRRDRARDDDRFYDR